MDYLYEDLLDSDYSNHPELFADLEDAYFAANHNDDLLNDYNSVTWLDSNNLATVFKYCVRPSIVQTIEKFAPVLAGAFLVRLIFSINRFSWNLKHLLSILVSLAVIFRFFSAPQCVYWLTLVALASFVTCFLASFAYLKLLAMILCGLHLALGQVYLDKDTWMSIRGAEMILVMKVVSLMFDSSLIRQSKNPLEIVHYFLCVHTSLVGTWLGFGQFIEPSLTSFWNVSEFMRSVKFGLLSLTSLCLSNCLFTLFEHLVETSLVVSTYFKAFSFRQSHYFICYFTQMLCSIGRVKSAKSIPKKSDDVSNNDQSGLSLVRQSAIELPWSMSQVVVNWNLTMHFWLKKYVFTEAKNRYWTFLAVLATYFVSSMLHGFDVNIALVLFSLGLFTFTELNFRVKLSRLLSCCIQAKECKKDCKHRYRQDNLYVKILNLIFLLINVWHLAYLGQLFYTESEDTSKSTLSLAHEKWSATYYSSHSFALVQVIACKLI